MRKTKKCETCLWHDSCGYPGGKCEKHQTFFDRRDQLKFTLEDWDEFTKEWDKARKLVNRYVQRK